MYKSKKLKVSLLGIVCAALTSCAVEDQFKFQELNFSDLGEVRIIGAYPEQNAEYVAKDTNFFSIQFNRPMNYESLLSGMNVAQVVGNNIQDLTAQTIVQLDPSSTTANFTLPLGQLSSNAKIRLILNTSVTSQSGNTFDNVQEYGFFTGQSSIGSGSGNVQSGPPSIISGPLPNKFPSNVASGCACWVEAGFTFNEDLAVVPIFEVTAGGSTAYVPGSPLFNGRMDTFTVVLSHVRNPSTNQIECVGNAWNNFKVSLRSREVVDLEGIFAEDKAGPGYVLRDAEISRPLACSF